jgi:hypothetical protein
MRELQEKNGRKSSSSEHGKTKDFTRDQLELGSAQAGLRGSRREHWIIMFLHWSASTIHTTAEQGASMDERDESLSKRCKKH